MGADIHIVVERQRDDASWERLWQHDYDKPDLTGTPKVFRDRNYDLFGILADVRNGHGFAGCLTGSGWPSIAANRGIPLDSTLTEQDERDYLVGDHSFTWADLEELKSFDWDHVKAEAYGVVSREEYTRMQQAGETVPTSWCGDISGLGVRVVTPEQLLEGTVPIPFTHVRMTWTETAREATYDWPGQVLPWLEGLAEGKKLRLVFGFDS